MMKPSASSFTPKLYMVATFSQLRIRQHRHLPLEFSVLHLRHLIEETAKIELKPVRRVRRFTSSTLLRRPADATPLILVTT